MEPHFPTYLYGSGVGMIAAAVCVWIAPHYLMPWTLLAMGIVSCVGAIIAIYREIISR